MKSHPWTDSFLNVKFQKGDPAADQVVELLYREGEIEAVNRLIRTLVRNSQPSPDELPDAVKEFLAESSRLPDFADRGRLRRGEEFFIRHGLIICVAFFCASLPAMYASPRGVKVLASTGRFVTDPRRRAAETMHFVMDCMSPGGVLSAAGASHGFGRSPIGRGITTALKVRLLHAAIRHLIRAQGHWRDDWGAPISQEYMASTLVALTFLVMRSLGRMGVKYRTEDADAYVHAWAVVGAVLGIDRDLLPDDLEDTDSMWQAVIRRGAGPSPEGTELTAALLDLLQTLVPRPLRGLPAEMIRQLSGDDVADMLGVPPARAIDRAINVLARTLLVLERAVFHREVIGSVAEHFSRRIINRLIVINRGGGRDVFLLPESLKTNWELGRKSFGAGGSAPPELRLPQ